MVGQEQTVTALVPLLYTGAGNGTLEVDVVDAALAGAHVAVVSNADAFRQIPDLRFSVLTLALASSY